MTQLPVRPGSLCLAGERMEWQALGRLRARFVPQQQCNFWGSGSVYIKGRSGGPDRVGGRQKYNANPMEYLWSSYGIPMESLWSNTPTTRPQQAERAGAGRRGSGELTELRGLARLAGAEGGLGAEGGRARQQGGKDREGRGGHGYILEAAK